MDYRARGGSKVCPLGLGMDEPRLSHQQSYPDDAPGSCSHMLLAGNAFPPSLVSVSHPVLLRASFSDISSCSKRISLCRFPQSLAFSKKLKTGASLPSSVPIYK